MTDRPRQALEPNELEAQCRRFFLERGDDPIRVASRGGMGLFYGLLAQLHVEAGRPESWRAKLNSLKALSLWHESEVAFLNSLLWRWVVAGILEPCSELGEDPRAWSAVILTRSGRERLSGDHPIPERQTAYIEALESKAPGLTETELFYVREALFAFNARLFPAALVMLGCAAEALVERIADKASRLIAGATREKYCRTIRDSSIAVVWREIEKVLESRWKDIAKGERALTHAAFDNLFLVVKTSRDDAGHPQSIPADVEKARPVFLAFPEAARVGSRILAYLEAQPEAS